MSSFTNDPKKMNREEEEIYNILYKKKEINDKTPKLRTEDEKKKLKNLSYKISKIPKNLIDNIITKFPLLQRQPLGGYERTAPPLHSPESTATRVEQELEPRRSVRTAKGSLAGGTQGQPRTEALTPSLPSGETPGGIALSSAKRKATVQGDALLESGGAPKTEGEGKRLRRSAVKDAPRRTTRVTPAPILRTRET